MAKFTVSEATLLAVLKHLAAGKSLEFVAEVEHLTRDEVVAIGSRHGYPDTRKLAWAADIVQGNIDRAARAASPQTAVAPGNPHPVPRPRPPLSVPNPPAAPAVEVVHDLAQMVERAAASRFARTRALGARLDGVATDLRARLDAEDTAEARKAAATAEREQRTAAAKAEKERAAAAAKAERNAEKIATLKARLAALEAGQPDPGATTTNRPKVGGFHPEPGDILAAKATGLSAALVRAWADQQGIPTSPGRLPDHVWRAYLNAHRGGAA